MSIFNVLSHEPDSGWEETVVEAGSVSADALRPAVSQGVARVPPLEQSTGLDGIRPSECSGIFFPAVMSDDGGVHGREVRTTCGPTHALSCTEDHLGWGVLGRVQRVKNLAWDGEDLEFHLHPFSCVSATCTVEPIDVGISHVACSFSHFSTHSPSAHLPVKTLGTGLQAYQLWNCDMSLVVTWLQMSVLPKSKGGGGEGRSVWSAPRIRKLSERTIFPPWLFSHPRVRKQRALCVLWHDGYCQETLETFIRYRKTLNKSQASSYVPQSFKVPVNKTTCYHMDIRVISN